MSNFTKEDVDLLYWHAVGKMRNGQFYGAHQFFRYVWQIAPSFEASLALAYCALRDRNLEQARIDLAKVVPNNARQERLYKRLAKRILGDGR